MGLLKGKKHWRLVCVEILLVITSIAGGFACVEVLFRWTDIDARIMGGYSVNLDQAFHHNYAPYQSFIQYPSSLESFVPVLNQINSLGIRGPEKEGPVDVLFLGDSFIQARSIVREKTLGVAFEQQLFKQQIYVSQISHGISSWSPLLEWNWYLKIGKKFSPKTLFLFVIWNDFLLSSQSEMTDASYVRQTAWTVGGRPDHFDLPNQWLGGQHWYGKLRVYQFLMHVGRKLRNDLPLLSVRDRWRRENDNPSVKPVQNKIQTAQQSTAEIHLLSAAEVTALLQMDHAAFENKLTEANIQEPIMRGFWDLQRPLSMWTDEQVKTVSLSEDIIKRFAADLNQDGGQLVLVYVPHPWQVGAEEHHIGRHAYGIADHVRLPEESGLQTWLRDMASRCGLTLLDPTAQMRAILKNSEVQDKLYTSWDGHWTEEGHLWMATWLSQWYLQHRVH